MPSLSTRYESMRIIPPHLCVHFVSEDQIRLLFSRANVEITNVDTGNFLIVTARILPDKLSHRVSCDVSPPHSRFLGEGVY